jgi:ATP/maltotriose-dependent transcriptional regulator MalT
MELATAEALLTEAAAVEELDKAVAAKLYADAALASLGSDVAAAKHAAENSLRLASDAGAEAAMHAMLAAAAVAVADGRAAEAERFARAGLARLEDVDPDESVVMLHQFSVVLFYLEEYAQARLLLERASVLARGGRSRPWLAIVLDTIAVIDQRTGRLSSATAKSLEALRLARESRDELQMASCLTTLAGIDAVQGRERSCRERARKAAALVPSDHLVHLWAALACAQLDLALGRPAAVVEVAPRLDAAFERIGGYPSLLALWLPVLIESHRHLGDVDAADAALLRLIVASDEAPSAGVRAITARCRGLIASAPDALPWFELALELHLDSPRPFERARTELCYGERLRRSRRPSEARLQLESALATFEQLRATPWAERARRELGAAAPRRRGSEPTETLTNHERQVAALVTSGASNREAAAALFVTPKTIEHHLTSIYAKLGIRSRTQLARILLTSRSHG